MYKEKLSEHLDGYDLCSDGELTPKECFQSKQYDSSIGWIRNVSLESFTAV